MEVVKGNMQMSMLETRICSGNPWKKMIYVINWTKSKRWKHCNRFFFSFSFHVSSFFIRCVLLPLLSVKPPQQALFLLVDSIDEGSQLGEGEQRSSPGSPRTIAELLASHHEFLPPWLLLICSARRQNKAITKLFTGKWFNFSRCSVKITVL